MPVFRIEIAPEAPDCSAGESRLVRELRDAGMAGVSGVRLTNLVFLEGALARHAVEQIAHTLLCDPVHERAVVLDETDRLADEPPGCWAFEVHLRAGVMDPVAESTLAELRAEGVQVTAVRTARRYVVRGDVSGTEVRQVASRVLANDCIEDVVLGTAGISASPAPPQFEFRVRRAPLSDLDNAGLDRLSREGHLFLSLDEMTAIRAHFADLRREPTDLELETLAQTWSEHCVHKTLKSAITYRGAPLPGGGETRRYENLLRDTIARATAELMAAGRGPECLSVFKDNAGVIAFDERDAVAFKVETHNHPSAIEPYGGAATGIGGVIRDVIGCGLGAKPIASTDVFCVAPVDWPRDRLPKGVLHPRRVLRGVVNGVGDYGNRMGIPTVNGAVYFDPRYLGNPLVYCGCVGLIPRDKIGKAARPGDLIVLIGGRTGRDGIHGATFSSGELTDTHADEFAHAVQIGNAITEKRFLEAVLRARDAEGGPLYTAITDCGAGGLSSAVGEMGAEVGATVDLEKVPLKYAGLRYDEIWISEAQERMVVAVPPAKRNAFLAIMAAEEAEATVIGTFGHVVADRPRLLVRYRGQTVGDLDMHFLHEGVPRQERAAEWWPIIRDSEPGGPGCAAEQRGPGPAGASDTLGGPLLARLLRVLAQPNVASNAWIIRRYDHEVQGASVVKPLTGPGRGPADAAVLRPRLSSARGIALGCGLAPHLSDIDPYWMAVAAIDEALRNVISVGGDPAQTAILDNFCWGRTDDPRQLGALVRACQACCDAALVYGLPFISGKDSLNNEFALDASDVDELVATLRAYAERDDAEARRWRAHLPVWERQIRARQRLAIPPTLLISALSLIADVERCVTPDLKHAGHELLLVGGFTPTGFALPAAARVHTAVAELIARRGVCACHDVSDGGWLTALAEMAIAGDRGVQVDSLSNPPAPFEEQCAAYVLEVADASAAVELLAARDVTFARVGHVTGDLHVAVNEQRVSVARARAAWSGDGSDRAVFG